MLQNLGVINANATGSLHSGKLQQGWDVAAVGHHTAEVSQDLLISLKPIRALLGVRQLTCADTRTTSYREKPALLAANPPSTLGRA